MLRRLIIALFVCSLTLPVAAAPLHRCAKRQTLPLAMAEHSIVRANV